MLQASFKNKTKQASFLLFSCKNIKVTGQLDKILEQAYPHLNSKHTKINCSQKDLFRTEKNIKIESSLICIYGPDSYIQSFHKLCY